MDSRIAMMGSTKLVAKDRDTSGVPWYQDLNGCERDVAKMNTVIASTILTKR